jgi:hypothetical protein
VPFGVDPPGGRARARAAALAILPVEELPPRSGRPRRRSVRPDSSTTRWPTLERARADAGVAPLPRRKASRCPRRLDFAGHLTRCRGAAEYHQGTRAEGALVTTFREFTPIVKSPERDPGSRQILGTIVVTTRSVQQADIEITEEKGERT